MIDPEKIPPESGALLAYGNQKYFGSKKTSALVTREMTTEGRQSKGKIHAKKILTPLSRQAIDISEEVAQEFVNKQITQINWQLVDLDVVVDKWLLRNKIEKKPYYIATARKEMELHIRKTHFFIGRNLWLENSYADLFEGYSRSDKRMELLELIKPRRMDLKDFFEDLEDEEIGVLIKLKS